MKLGRATTNCGQEEEANYNTAKRVRTPFRSASAPVQISTRVFYNIITKCSSRFVGTCTFSRTFCDKVTVLSPVVLPLWFSQPSTIRISDS